MSGLFGTEADLMVDLFLLLLVALLPVLVAAVLLARSGRTKAHSRVMTCAFVLFAAALVMFEIHVRTEGTPALPAWPLVIHLCFAVPALLLWIFQVSTGKRAYRDPAPHRRRGRILFGLLVATVATGIWLYVATFA